MSALTSFVLACGTHPRRDPVLDDASPAPDAPVVVDARPAPDAPGCCGTGLECDNCVDDDGDGLIDGDDPHCSSGLDDAEGSFHGGFPVNIDPSRQDCYFDGNTGAGDDGCIFHVCCVLDECPPELQSGFDPTRCVPSAECVQRCLPMTTPGCDCFGCCTACNENGCFDVLLSEWVSGDCTVATLHDPAACLPCTRRPECSRGACGGATCITCRGQTDADLDPACPARVCPDGLPACSDGCECADGEYCATGCCVSATFGPWPP